SLAWMYAHGEGVPENAAEAVKWYRKAAEQGLAVAQYNLAQMYLRGEAVAEDKIQAYLWYSLAKAQGHKGAKHNLEILKDAMTKQQIAQASPSFYQEALIPRESEFRDCG
nr:sel1 repeat family protein [Porticoccaceae bacterium]